VVDDVFIDSEKFLVTDFINLKIKPTQFFKCAHRDRMYACVLVLKGVECACVYL
jgi:hypothetical protein